MLKPLTEHALNFEIWYASQDQFSVDGVVTGAFDVAAGRTTRGVDLGQH